MNVAVAIYDCNNINLTYDSSKALHKLIKRSSNFTCYSLYYVQEAQFRPTPYHCTQIYSFVKITLGLTL